MDAHADGHGDVDGEKAVDERVQVVGNVRMGMLVLILILMLTLIRMLMFDDDFFMIGVLMWLVMLMLVVKWMVTMMLTLM